MNNTKQKLPKGLSGIAGEYFVAAELSVRGFMASITLRNNDSIDIHASKLEENKIVAIQVKTNQHGHRSWPLNQKSENLRDQNIFYIFVAMKGIEQRPEYFIVPSTVVADHVKTNHQNWLDTPGKNGRAHVDTPMRNFSDKEGKYLEKWHLLK